MPEISAHVCVLVTWGWCHALRSWSFALVALRPPGEILVPTTTANTYDRKDISHTHTLYTQRDRTLDRERLTGWGTPSLQLSWVHCWPPVVLPRPWHPEDLHVEETRLCLHLGPSYLRTKLQKSEKLS